MRLSIAMTTYNGERFVDEQMLSLLHQTHPADEVVIVDDCSCDRTVKRIEAFIERHGLSTRGWTLYKNSEQLGFKANFKRAFSLTTGDLIAPCDQDDIWKPEKLKTMCAAIKADKRIRSLGCAFELIDADGAVIERQSKLLPSSVHVVRGGVTRLTPFDDNPLLLLGANRLLGCTMLVDRPMLNAYLACTRGEIAHDWEINLIAAMEGGLFFLDEALIEYRLHGNNAIGLRSGGQRGMRPDAEGRKRVHAGFEGALRFAQAYREREGKPPLSERYAGYAQTRKALLEKRSMKALVRLWTQYSDIYSELYGFRQLMGDVLMTMQGNRERKGSDAV